MIICEVCNKIDGALNCAFKHDLYLPQVGNTTDNCGNLCWPDMKEGDFVKVDRSTISSFETGINPYPRPIPTLQPMPRNATDFQFSANIVRMDVNHDFVVGLYSDIYFACYSHGYIQFHDKQIEHLDSLKVGDKITFALRRISIANDNLNLCHVMLNGQRCCEDVILEGLNIYPFFKITSPATEIVTSFQIKQFSDASGI